MNKIPQNYKIKIVEEMHDEYLADMFNGSNTIYVKPGIYAMSTRKIESLMKIAELQKYYQCNPVKFIDDFFNIELIDAQAWIVQRSWNCPNVLVVATRGLGKSTVIDLILMAKGMLFNNYWAYIASGSGGQAEQTFTTLERLANDNIDEMSGSTGYIFKNEVEIKNAAGDGFSHSSNGFTYSLYNGAKTQTLNSNVDAKRGQIFIFYINIYMNKFILMEEIINMERWTKEEEQYLIENYMTEMYCDIARKINKTENAIRAKCFELRLVKKNSWTQDEIDFIKENYQKLSIKQIAKILNRTENAVKLKAAKNGCKRSPYCCDYNFFNTIDTEKKAYWFGFIAADGWISINKEANSGVVGIELQVSDIDHLKKFNKDINGNYQIKTRARECKISTKQGSISEECNIRIFSIDMVNDLINHGITSNKTHEFQFPILRDDLMSHFIRGYFDGDGCVRTRARRLSSGQVVEYPVCDIVSANQKFLDDLRAFLYKKYDICSYIYAEKSGCYRLYIHKNEHTINFLNFMYKNSTVYLDRKYKIYLNIVKNNTTNDGLAV